MVNKNKSAWWGKFVVKTTICAGLSLIIGPASSILIGASTWGTSKFASNIIEDEDIKEVFNFISDCGGDLVIGGVLGGVGNLVTSSGSSSVVKTVAKESVTYQAKKEAGKQAGEWAAKKIAEGGSKELFSNLARKKATEKTIDIINKKIAEETIKNVNKQLASTITKGVIEGSYKSLKDNLNKEFLIEEAKFHSEHLKNGSNFEKNCKICIPTKED